LTTPAAYERSWFAPLERRPLFAASVFAFIALTLAAELNRTAPPDMAFLLYAAGRVLDGAQLYRDVVEINPPLVIWLNLPIEAVARALHASEFVAYRLFAAAFIGLVFGLCYRIVRLYVLPDRPVFGRYVLLLLCVALFPLAGDDFGQREHFVFALLTPNLLLVAARARGPALRANPPRYRETALVGVLAGLAVALKPHFLLAWLALTLFQPLRGRWRLTTETSWTLACLVAYGALVFFAAPEYLTMAALLGPSYLQYLKEPWYSIVVLAPGAPLVFVSLLAVGVLWRYARNPALWAVVALEVVACYLAGVAQQKGLRYHFYPSFALALVLLGIVAADAPVAAPRLSERLYARVARVLTVTIGLVVIVLRLVDLAGGTAADRRARAELNDLAAFVHDHAGGRPVGVLSYHIGSAFPLVNYAEVTLASRFPHLWLLPTSYWDELQTEAPLVYHTPAEMQPPEEYLWNAVRRDLMDAQPRLILVLRSARDVPENGLRRLQYVAYFGRDPDLADLFQRYELVAKKGEYDVYQRLGPGAARTAPAPSASPGTSDVLQSQPGKVRLAILEPAFLIGVLAFAAVWGLSVSLDRRRTKGSY